MAAFKQGFVRQFRKKPTLQNLNAAKAAPAQAMTRDGVSQNRPGAHRVQPTYHPIFKTGAQYAQTFIEFNHPMAGVDHV